MMLLFAYFHGAKVQIIFVTAYTSTVKSDKSCLTAMQTMPSCCAGDAFLEARERSLA